MSGGGGGGRGEDAGGGGTEMRRSGEGRARATHGDVQGGEVGRDGAGAGGGDDCWLRLLEKPLYGFTIGFMAELTGELEDASGAEGRHADAASTAFDLGVTIFGG